MAIAMKAAQEFGMKKGQKVVVVLPDSIRNYMYVNWSAVASCFFSCVNLNNCSDKKLLPGTKFPILCPIYFKTKTICCSRTKILSDDWMETKGFIETDNKKSEDLWFVHRNDYYCFL